MVVIVFLLIYEVDFILTLNSISKNIGKDALHWKMFIDEFGCE
jgi:hypothetical protein